MITVTGATGELGRLVVDGLLERVPADQITAAVRNPEKAEDLATRGLNVRRADYEEPDTLRSALEGTDRLLMISTNNPLRAREQHTAVVEAATRADVGLLVFTSVVAAAPPRRDEPVVQASGLPFTILRNAQYMEHYFPQIKQALDRGVLVGSAGDGRTAPATHADLAAAAVAVLTGNGHENKTYTLTGDTAWSLADLAAEIGAASGRRISYRNVSSEEHLELLTAAGVPRMYADVFVATYAAIAAGAFATATTDLRDLIGRPTTTLAESVATIVN